ncbi:MAG: DUF4358 domain-containing protein [Oscillospiraceae bacterium]
MKLKIMILGLAISLVLTGCNSAIKKDKANEESVSSSSQSSVVASDDPEGALKEIYKTIEIKGVTDGNEKYATEVIGLDESDFYACYIKKTDGKFGVSDIYIIEPEIDKTEEVTKILNTFRDKRVLEFTDYNIYNSLEIAQNAQVIQRGKYVILVMVEDVEGATQILKNYIAAK